MNSPTPTRSSLARFAVLTPLLSLVLLLLHTGCNTVSGTGTGSFASVTISNHSIAEIAATTAKTFAADGYRGGAIGSSQLVFEKQASRGSTLARDGLIAAQSGARSVHRVRVEIVPVTGGAHRLECQAYMVSSAGDSFFENEVALANVRRGPYQSLLNQVAKQLK